MLIYFTPVSESVCNDTCLAFAVMARVKIRENRKNT